MVQPQAASLMALVLLVPTGIIVIGGGGLTVDIIGGIGLGRWETQQAPPVIVVMSALQKFPEPSVEVLQQDAPVLLVHLQSAHLQSIHLHTCFPLTHPQSVGGAVLVGGIPVGLGCGLGGIVVGPLLVLSISFDDRCW